MQLKEEGEIAYLRSREAVMGGARRRRWVNRTFQLVKTEELSWSLSVNLGFG